MSTKTRLLASTAVASLLLAGSAPTEASQFNGWYIGLEAGASWVDDTDVNTTFDYGPVAVRASEWTDGGLPSRVNFDTGWAAFATLGYAWRNWRVEGELGWRQNDFDVDPFFSKKMSPGPSTALVSEGPWFGGKNRSGELSEFSQMINVIYDWHWSERFSLSLGAGIGGDLVDVDARVGPLVVNDDDYVFAWQLIAGLNYALSPGSTLFVNYRYFNANDPEFEGFIPGPDIVTHHEVDDLQKHSVTVGIRFDLNPDEVAVAPPPPAPPPEPMPPAPAAPRTFDVFFANNKANLSAEALASIRDAAAQARQTGSATLRIEGGGGGKLTARRASALRRALVDEGIANSAISTAGNTVEIHMSPSP